MPKIRGVKPTTWTDGKFVSLSPLARLLFMGMWTEACDNGHVEDDLSQLKIRLLPMDDCDIADVLAELLASGQVVRVGGCLKVVNLAEHQKPDRRFLTLCEHCAHDEQARYSDADKLPKRRAHAVHSAGTQRVHGDDGEGDGDGDGDSKISSEVADATPDADREDVARVCQHLADRVIANGSKRPRVTKKWREEARLLLDVDKRTEEQVHKAIDWCQTNAFWRSNVMSMRTLREKYDQLRLSAEREVVQRQRSPSGGLDLDAAMARAQARDAQRELSA
jgi:hypothetical protein